MKRMSPLPTAVESLEEEDVEAVVQQSERYHLRQKNTTHLLCKLLAVNVREKEMRPPFFVFLISWFAK